MTLTLSNACNCMKVRVVSVSVGPSLNMFLFKREYHPGSRHSTRSIHTAGLLTFIAIYCIISELDSRFSSLSRSASKVLQLVPTIVLAIDGEKHDFNDLVAMYESDLVDKYLVDQELMLWKRKWAQCSPA